MLIVVINRMSLVVMEDLCRETPLVEREMHMGIFLRRAEFMTSKLWNTEDLWSPGRYEKWKDCKLIAEFMNPVRTCGCEE